MLNLACMPGMFLVVILLKTLYLKLMAAAGRDTPGSGASILPITNLARGKKWLLDNHESKIEVESLEGALTSSDHEEGNVRCGGCGLTLVIEVHKVDCKSLCTSIGIEAHR